jgi:hypothetical protein
MRPRWRTFCTPCTTSLKNPCLLGPPQPINVHLILMLAASGCAQRPESVLPAEHQTTNPSELPKTDAQQALHPQLQVYSDTLESAFLEQNGLNPPYGALFSAPGHPLLYIAANHTSDPKSETYGWINRAFTQYHPDYVIIEGMAGTESPKTLMAYINTLPPYSCPENLYAARCAIKNQVPFMGAEPPEDAVVNALFAKKYTKKDLDFLYVVQQMGYYYRSSSIPFKSLDDLPTVFALCVKDLKKPGLRLTDFKQWYEQRLNMTLSYRTLMDPNHCAPLRHGTPLQQLASTVSVIRDQHILSVILKAMKTHKKVLVVYGHSHFVTQKDVLCAHFGKPRYVTLQTDSVSS